MSSVNATEQSMGITEAREITTARAASIALVPLFTAALFASAFLLFLVQPMVAKMVLPLLGGSPMVWNTCMVFFQIVLFAGYAYAHGSVRWLGAKWQIAVHLAVLILPFAFLPFLIQRDSFSPPEGTPVFWLLGLLAGTIAFPFFALATTASVLQHWFSFTDHGDARDPYFLYAASNIGSLAALAAYPVVVEPLLALRAQGTVWTIGYALFVVLVGGCASVAWRQRPRADVERPAALGGSPEARVRILQRLRWVALSFVPSSLMLAVTTYLSTDIAAVPLFWILPLSIYLLTFVAAFSTSRWWLASARRSFPVLLVPLAVMLSVDAVGTAWLMFPLHIVTFGIAALICHAQLADERPSAAHLTQFYLWMSFGGMLGGFFNALAAPFLFDSIAEYPLVVLLACFLMPRIDRAATGRKRVDPGVLVAIGIAMALVMVGIFSPALRRSVMQMGILVPAILAFTQRHVPRRFGFSVAALIVVGMALGHSSQRLLVAERTFFGVYRVKEDRQGEYRALAHGTTLHGKQAIKGSEQGEPLTYFHRQGPFGQAFDKLPAAQRGKQVGVIGLGIGTLAAFARPEQEWTFYEIDPAVERIARNRLYFDFLDRCGERCRTVIGDARLSLQRAPESKYDLFVLDAFSSDAIPMHLLTSEALSLYLSRLKDDGAVLFHISNRHLVLEPIVGRLAQAHGLTGVVNFDRPAAGWPASRTSSRWVAMARRPEDLGDLASDPRWVPLTARRNTPLWTDDFSNVVSVLRILGEK